MQKRFVTADQDRFASLSGDRNPIHVDPVLARRTQSGAPVVHGIHLLCWALDAFAAACPDTPPPRRLRAQFSRFVHVGETVTLDVVRRGAGTLVLRLLVAGQLRSTLTMDEADKGNAREALAQDGTLFAPATALDLSVEAMVGRLGRLVAAAEPAEIDAAFPAAAAWLGKGTFAELCASTRLVGMVFPGLHSIYVGLDVAIGASDAPCGSLAFRVDPARHGLFAVAIDGGRMRGVLQCVGRVAPTSQVAMSDLRDVFAGRPFAGANVLVVGGSRGLGELTAKLVASGGAAVTITYNVGAADATRVADDIAAHGGACTTLRHRVGDDSVDLRQAGPFTHAYYFAAPTIARPNSTFFDAQRLTEMNAVFVEGFWSLAETLLDSSPAAALFYPSTTFVDDRPRGMAEYAMAKAAGEVLCAEMNAALPSRRVIVHRLPPLATDQTAGLSQLASSLDILTPIVAEVQGTNEA